MLIWACHTRGVRVTLTQEVLVRTRPIRLSVTFSASDMMQIRAIADREDLKVAQVIRRMVRTQLASPQPIPSPRTTAVERVEVPA